MENVIIIVLVAVIIVAVVISLFRAKKRGETCIGCPYCKQCSGKGACGSAEPNHPPNN